MSKSRPAAKENADRLLLGFDVGGTKSAVLVGNSAGEILEKIVFPSNAARGPEAMLADFFDRAKLLHLQYPTIDAVGVSIGGPLDVKKGVIHNPPHLPGWNAFPLKSRIEERLQLPAYVEHDAIACALAEYRFGRYQKAQSLIYLTCGTGFGMGMIHEGRPFRGVSGHPSDLGHVRYRESGPLLYGKRGSFEGFTSGTGVSERAAERFPELWGKERPTLKKLKKYADEGSQPAQEILHEAARSVGDVCALLADLLYPEVILIGSMGLYLGEGWMELVRKQFQQEAYADAQSLCRIDIASLGAKLQDLSSLAPAIRA